MPQLNAPLLVRKLADKNPIAFWHLQPDWSVFRPSSQGQGDIYSFNEHAVAETVLLAIRGGRKPSTIASGFNPIVLFRFQHSSFSTPLHSLWCVVDQRWECISPRLIFFSLCWAACSSAAPACSTCFLQAASPVSGPLQFREMSSLSCSILLSMAVHASITANGCFSVRFKFLSTSFALL